MVNFISSSLERAENNGNHKPDSLSTKLIGWIFEKKNYFIGLQLIVLFVNTVDAKQ